jgi:hypothetical protein
MRKIIAAWTLTGALFLLWVPGIGADTVSSGYSETIPTFMANAGTIDSDAFYTVAALPEGGYAGFGKAGDDAVVAKFNVYGHLDWTKSFSGVLTSNSNTGAAGEGCLFLTGRTASDTLWVAKLASWGTVLWQKTYTYSGYSSPNIIGSAMAATQDGGCAISIRVNVDGFSGAYNYDQGLVKIAADGTLEWIKFYGTAAYDSAGVVIESKDASGMVDGYMMITNEDGWGGTDLGNEVIMIKVDTSGVIQWVKALAGLDSSDLMIPDGNEFVKGACRTQDAGYAVVGCSYSASDPEWSNRRTPYILKTDSTGNFVWAKKFGVLSSDPESNAFSYGDVTQAYGSGDLIIAGSTHASQSWLLRLSEDGALKQERVYPVDGVYDQLSSVSASDDGGAVASRWSKTFGAGDYDAFLMKFDANLSFPDTACDNGEDPESEFADMRFDIQDVTENCHELDYTDQWTTQDGENQAYDPEFWLWQCAVDQDLDGDGIVDHEDNCPKTRNSGQEDVDGDGMGNACDCDLDNSGIVNQMDFMIFRSAWGTDDSKADFNGDSKVNQMDFMIFRQRWGTAYPWY